MPLKMGSMVGQQAGAGSRLSGTIDGLHRLAVPVAVRSTGSLLEQQDMRAELSMADWVSLKIDPATRSSGGHSTGRIPAWNWAPAEESAYALDERTLNRLYPLVVAAVPRGRWSTA